MYIFSIGCLFSGYYVNQIFQNPALSGNSNITYNALHTLANSFAVNQQVNTSLIFGDFVAGLTVLFGILSGTTIANAFSIFPFVDAGITLLIQIVFSASSLFLWIYIVANRSV